MSVGSEVVRAVGAPTYEQLRDLLGEQAHTISRQEETLAKVAAMIDARGWNRVGGVTGSATGLDIATLRKASEQLRPYVTADSILKRISDLQGFYAYGAGIGFNRLGNGKRAFLDDHNITRLFSATALEEINRAHGTDGNAIFLVNTRTKRIIRVPFEQVGVPWIDGDDPELVWYVRRTYTKRTVAKPHGETIDVYYTTPETPVAGLGPDYIEESPGKRIPIDKEWIAVNWRVNSQTGWPLGVPDLLASLRWVDKYDSYLANQAKFAEALALLAWQFKASTADQAKKQAAVVAGSTEIGGTAGSVNGYMEAQRGNSDVSFENGEPLAAAAAVGANMVLDDVLGKSGNAAAKQLDPMVKAWVRSRREAADRFFRQIGKLLGAPKLEIVWPEIDDESPFREAQMMIAAWGTGLFEPEEIRNPVAARLRIPTEEGSKAPQGVLIPNNEKTAKLNKPDPAKDDEKAGGVNKQGDDELKVGKTSDGDNEARDKGE
ncbi:hypothetical protein [Agromyces sp. NPDC058104]|uniref:hypothetical protein n=1 Tax=Agromyces sp. NPDC058104 TaxID=3346342 RepID=UPI0036DA66B1